MWGAFVFAAIMMAPTVFMQWRVFRTLKLERDMVEEETTRYTVAVEVEVDCPDNVRALGYAYELAQSLKDRAGVVRSEAMTVWTPDGVLSHRPGARWEEPRV